jgi:hypothetical protein
MPDRLRLSPPAMITRNPLKSRPRRTAIALTILVAVLAIVAVITNLLEKQPDLLLIKQIRIGMTEVEVAGIFGDSPTTTTPWQIERLYAPSTGSRVAKYWYCDAGIVRVFFGNDGRVVSVNQHRYDREVENPMARRIREFLRRLGLW